MNISSMKSYQECLKEMYSLKRFGIVLGLSTIQNILEKLDNPQTRYKCIHVAGTNGKGSIASSLSTILTTAGYRVGLYTSPHLVRFNERICINNRPISNKDVAAAYQTVKKVHQGDREPTFFEYNTAMAFYEFHRKKVKWAIIETGMGGRLDATNIVLPAVSIISNISLEHQAYLGNTISDIAGEKGGIIKPYIPVVTGAKQKKAIEVIEKIARKNSAPLYRRPKAFRTRKKKDGSFTYFGINHVWPGIKINLPGRHQTENAALVLAACEILKESGIKISLEDIKKGLFNNRWPGRLEVVSKNPMVILDGAHNLIAARNLGKYLTENLKDKKITLILGILNDKPYQAMLECLVPLANKLILTCPVIDRALKPESLYPTAKRILHNVKIIPKVQTALQYAVEKALPNDVICVAGSLYVVGEAKKAIESMDLF